MAIVNRSGLGLGPGGDFANKRGFGAMSYFLFNKSALMCIDSILHRRLSSVLSVVVAIIIPYLILNFMTYLPFSLIEYRQ